MENPFPGRAGLFYKEGFVISLPSHCPNQEGIFLKSFLWGPVGIPGEEAYESVGNFLLSH